MTKNKLTTLADLPLPSTQAVEDALLGGLIASPEYINDARKVIDADAFADAGNAALWNTLLELHDTTGVVDIAAVYPSNPAAVQRIIGQVVPLSFSEGAVRIDALAKAAKCRRMYLAALQALQSSAEGNIRAAEDAVTGYLAREDGRGSGKTAIHISEAINNLADEVQAKADALARGIRLQVPTSLPTLDSYTYGGFGKGNLVVLAARPSVGKTAVGGQMALAAARCGIPAVFFSLEMTNNELTRRQMVSTGRIEAYKLASGIDVDWQQYDDVAAELSPLPLQMVDDAYYLDDIVARISSLARQGKCKAAYIDYLGLIRVAGVGYGDRAEITALSEATRRLKMLAKQLQIPIVLLAQLNRDSSRENRAPSLFDLRGSGSIEQDADVCIFLHRPNEDDREHLQLLIRKNRQGQLGDIDLTALNNYCTFVEGWQ